MKRFFTEISYDVNFLKGHTLQPAWVKVVKIFILPAVLAGFILLFGWRRAAVFTVVFVLLMLVVHMIYRANTRKFTRNWMDLSSLRMRRGISNRVSERSITHRSFLMR